MLRQKFRFILNLVIFIILSFLSVGCNGACPTDNDVVDVDLNQIAGEWYMVAGTPVAKGLGACQHFEVKAEGTNSFYMNYTTTSYRNGKRLIWHVNGNQLDNCLSATWQLNGSPRVLGPFKHQIITIDYTSYAAMVICANDTKDIPRKRFAMIWSRERELAPAVLSMLKDSISRYVNMYDINDVDNSCSGIRFP